MVSSNSQPSEKMEEMLLSIVLFGRNDSYREDYLYRVETTISMFSQGLSDLGRVDNSEILFVDWGSEQPMRDAITLDENGAKLTSFLEVTPEQAIDLSSDGAIYVCAAVNAGVRRSSGRFIMLTDVDCLYTYDTLRQMFEVIEGRAGSWLDVKDNIFNIRRHQVSRHIVERQPSIEWWNGYLRRSYAGQRSEYTSASSLGGFAAAHLMHRDIWHETRGYWEIFDSNKWGWGDNDLFMRVTQEHDWFDLSYLGIRAFHMEHPSILGLDVRGLPPREVNLMRIAGQVATNDANWGLRDMEIACRQAPPADKKRLESSRTHSSQYLKTPETRFFSLEAIKKVMREPSMCQKYDDALVNMIDHHVLPCKIQDGKIHLTNVDDIGIAETIKFLVAIAAVEKPASILFFGEVDWMSTEVMLPICFGSDIIFANPFQTGVSDSVPLNPMILSARMEEHAYQGYARIIGGGTENALNKTEVIAEEFGGFDFVYVNLRNRQSNIRAALPHIFSLLKPSGCLFIFDPFLDLNVPDKDKPAEDILAPFYEFENQSQHKLHFIPLPSWKGCLVRYEE